MEPVYGIHLGLVVSSSTDPENRNRVQVWIPYLTNTLYKSLNSKLTDLTFKGPEDLNLKDPLILQTLQKILPWAEYAAPLLGGSSGVFNTSTGKTATNAGSTIQQYKNPDITLTNITFNFNHQGDKLADTKIQNGAGFEAGTASPFTGTAGGIGNNWAGSLPKLQAILPQNQTYDPSSQKRDRQNTSSGFISDHYAGNSSAYAVDLGLNSQFKNSTQAATQTAIDTVNNIRTANGQTPITSWSQVPNGVYNGTTPDGFRVQVLWQTNVGGNHFDHVHVGVKNIGSGNTNSYETTSVKTPTEKSSGPNPVPIIDRSAVVGSVPTNIGTPGSAVGSFSTPNAGSKVWVFFLGGDIQRPVYFAQSPNPSDIAALTS
jgi:hypothetical protein